ncbi:M56 family metallopeptidase [Chitinophaga cymbidii]|uniref:Cell envelope biogenesis protein TonB n=1 Tax=Chitinophaga cymbidii TaxID=1096750 RepID=A0A512RDT5_9BACT|nr:M56 family metallopeptidase [Chitinophaga cymbidii]GEP93860.1 cell envelope biogenesis protein TonB [Chitinophaga cymbidii]
MTPLLAYLVKVIICSGILYGYYHMALRNNRFHQWNRYYVLLSTLLSLVVPLIRIPLSFTPEETQGIYVYTSQVVTLREQVFTPSAAQQATYVNWAVWLYGAIILFCLLRLCAGYFRILRLVYRSRVEFIKPYWLVLSEQIAAPFSFFKYIFWNSGMNADSTEGRQILQHEMVHLQEKHSTDKLFMEIITAICWINPFFHLFKRELTLVHEFIADKKAAQNGNAADYAQTILYMALQSGPNFSMTNSFSQHPIKRRIFMLTTSRQLRFSYLRRLMILPIATMIFCSLAFVVNENHSFANVINPADTIPPPPPPAPSAQFKPDTLPNNEEVFTFVEQPPSFPGGDPALAKFLNQNIRYPHAATEKGKGGTIFVSFVVTKDGSVKNVKTVGAKKGYGLEEEAVRVVKLMPKWKPGKQNNRLVNVQFNLPIRFTLQEVKPEKKAPKVGKDGVYTYADVMPKFPGGDEGLARYLSTNIRYPADATKLGIMGNVLVSFTLDTEGNIKDVRAVNKPVLGSGLEEEGIRVVKSMPKWRPAMDGGKTVPIRFAVPIRFQLQH